MSRPPEHGWALIDYVRNLDPRFKIVSEQMGAVWADALPDFLTWPQVKKIVLDYYASSERWTIDIGHILHKANALKPKPSQEQIYLSTDHKIGAHHAPKGKYESECLRCQAGRPPGIDKDFQL